MFSNKENFFLIILLEMPFIMNLKPASSTMSMGKINGIFAPGRTHFLIQWQTEEMWEHSEPNVDAQQQ